MSESTRLALRLAMIEPLRILVVMADLRSVRMRNAPNLIVFDVDRKVQPLSKHTA